MFVDYVLIDQERCLLTMASLTRKDVARVIQSSIIKSRAYFNRLLRALFEKWNAYFSTKKSKNTYPIGGSGVLNAINLKKWEIKIKKCALWQGLIALFYYTPPPQRIPLFSRISPGIILMNDILYSSVKLDALDC